MMLISKPTLLLSTALVAVSMVCSLAATNDKDGKSVSSSPSKKRKVEYIQGDSSCQSALEENVSKKKKTHDKENLDVQIHSTWNGAYQSFKSIERYSDCFEAYSFLQGVVEKLPEIGKMNNSKAWQECFKLAVKNPGKINLENKDALWKSFFFKNIRIIENSLEERVSHYLALKDYENSVKIYDNIVTHYKNILFFSSKNNAAQVTFEVLTDLSMADKKWGDFKFEDLIKSEMTAPTFEAYRKVAPSLVDMALVEVKLKNKFKEIKEDFKKKNPNYVDTEESFLPNIVTFDHWRANNN